MGPASTDSEVLIDLYVLYMIGLRAFDEHKIHSMSGDYRLAPSIETDNIL